MTTFDTKDQMQIVRRALERIASVSDPDGRIMVSVPVMYPSGATSTVEVQINQDNCWVSDQGFGFVEAEYLGATEYYPKAARDAAEAYGVQFDGSAVFALWVPKSRIEAAIVCVSNASNRAASEAIRVASEKKSSRRNDEIFERITSIFGPQIVAKSAEIRGRHVAWPAHNVVSFPDRHQAVFEYMTRHSNSASSKFFMFSDLKQADENMSLNAVVANVSSLDAKAQMVGDVANIISIDSTEDSYRRYARAA